MSDITTYQKTLQTVSFQKYWTRLSEHNWLWCLADVNSEYRKGKMEEDRLKKLAESRSYPYAVAYRMWKDRRVASTRDEVQEKPTLLTLIEELQEEVNEAV